MTSIAGPMIRSNVYMLQQQQQQQITGRGMYARQPGPMGGMESIQQNSSDWRHLLMSQQQNANFGSMRPGFQGSTYSYAYIQFLSYILKVNAKFQIETFSQTFVFGTCKSRVARNIFDDCLREKLLTGLNLIISKFLYI